MAIVALLENASDEPGPVFLAALRQGLVSKLATERCKKSERKPKQSSARGQFVCTGTRAGEKAQKATGARGRQSATREGGGKRGVSRMSGFQVNTCVRGSFVVCIRFVCLQSLHCVLASRKLRGFAGLASRRGTGESGRVESN